MLEIPNEGNVKTLEEQVCGGINVSLDLFGEKKPEFISKFLKYSFHEKFSASHSETSDIYSLLDPDEVKMHLFKGFIDETKRVVRESDYLFDSCREFKPIIAKMRIEDAFLLFCKTWRKYEQNLIKWFNEVCKSMEVIYVKDEEDGGGMLDFTEGRKLWLAGNTAKSEIDRSRLIWNLAGRRKRKRLKRRMEDRVRIAENNKIKVEDPDFDLLIDIDHELNREDEKDEYVDETVRETIPQVIQDLEFNDVTGEPGLSFMVGKIKVTDENGDECTFDDTKNQEPPFKKFKSQ